MTALSADLPDAAKYEALSAPAHAADPFIKGINQAGNQILRFDCGRCAICPRLAARGANRVLDIHGHSGTQVALCGNLLARCPCRVKTHWDAAGKNDASYRTGGDILGVEDLYF